jgi:pilus assembly protein CpaC
LAHFQTARGAAGRWGAALAALAVVVAAAPLAWGQPGGTPAPKNGAATPPPAAAAEPLGMPRPVGRGAGGTGTIADIGPRLQGSQAAQTFGSAPIPTQEDLDRYKRFVRGFTDPQLSIDLIQNRSRLLHLKEAPFRIQVSDERVMSYTVLNVPTELSLIGQQVGSTILNMWFGDRNDPANQTILSWQVNVLPDPDAKRRLEQVYKALQDEINAAFPDSYVCLTLVGDKLVISGEAKDAIEATQIIQLIRTGGGGTSAGVAQNPVLQQNPAGSNVTLNLFNPNALGYLPGIPEGQTRPDLSNYILQGESNIINLLRIPGEQQVMLKVAVAEMTRGAARSIGFSYAIRNNQGIQVFAFNGNGTQGNLPFVLDNGQINLAIQALRNVNQARSLAEQHLTTLNGIPATFFAGGQFPVPVVTGATATGLQGVSFVPFGVFLQFTPVITSKDRVRLQVSAQVSTRDPSLGASFGGTGGVGGLGNTNVPGLQARTISTTVEMREGQTFAIGGLMQTHLGGQTSRVPLLGDIPIGGQLFRRDETSASESELVLLVTPQLVHPLEPNELPPLPGSDYFEPGDLEFYLLGRQESSRPYDYRSAVMNDINRMAAYRRCQLLYFVGPSGHSDGR